MRLRLVLAPLALIALAAPARADFTIAIGTKVVPVNYTTPLSTSGAGGGDVALNGWNTTNLNNYLGFFFAGQYGFHISLDLGFSSRHDETPAGGGTKTDFSYTQFGFALGGKVYFTKPRAQKVSPYGYLDFFKYFASVSTSATVPKGYEGYVANLVSPLGIDIAVGAEYFVTPAFSIGAEVLGLKYAYTNASYDASPTGIGGNTTISETNHALSFFTGLSLNYRFDVAVAARVREASDEEEEQPRPRKKKAQPSEDAPKGEAPPPSPESVD